MDDEKQKETNPPSSNYASVINRDTHIGIGAYTGYGKTVLGDYFIRKFATVGTVVVYNTDFETHVYPPNVKVFNPPKQSASDLTYLNTWIRKLRASGSNYTIYIRDLDRFFDSGSALSKSASELKDLISTGRHQGVNLIYEFKQPSYIPSKIFSGTQLLFIGNFTEYNDVKKLRNYADRKELQKITKPIFIMVDRRVNRRFAVKLNTATNRIDNIGELQSLIK